MPPGGNAVGFVDGEQRDLDAYHGGKEGGRLEPLGRDIDEPDLSPAQRRLPLLPLGLVE